MHFGLILEPLRGPKWPKIAPNSIQEAPELPPGGQEGHDFDVEPILQSFFGFLLGPFFRTVGSKVASQRLLFSSSIDFHTIFEAVLGPLDRQKQAFRMILSSFLKDPPFSKKGAKMDPKWTYFGTP